MNLFIVGRIFWVEAALLLIPLFVAVHYHEATVMAFLIPILLLLAVGALLSLNPPRNKRIYARDGFFIVTASWVLMSFFGCLPFILSHEIPHFIDAYFETVSGFTTTGASILTEIESHSRGILFWRSFTHWIGGMGVLVFLLAILPMAEGRGMHVMRAESPGPSVGKLVSRIQDTTRILYSIYIILTLLEVVFLLLGGMPLYDAFLHAVATSGTGGFSTMNQSVASYGSAYIDIVIGVFMLLFGVNFNMYYFLLLRRFRDVWRSEELRTYLGITVVSVVLIAINIAHLYGGFFHAMRYSFFQVSTMLTSTGFATADFNLWPSFSRALLILIACIGASAGSTGGGFKVARIVIVAKSIRRELRRLVHPQAVTTLTYEGKPLDDNTLRATNVFMGLYMGILFFSTLLISLNGFDLETSFTAVVATLNNTGPGLGMVGPAGNYSAFSVFSKVVLILDMLIGRLEIFPIVVLMMPSALRRRF